MHIANPEGSRVGIVSVGIFAWAEEEEETKYDHLAYCLLSGIVSGEAMEG
jgi:hypothetical protein